MRINLKLFTTFSKIGNKNHDFMRVSEALIHFNCQTREPGEWQTIDASIRGYKITVYLNGVLIQDNVEIPEGKKRIGTGTELGCWLSDGFSNDPEITGPIMIQGNHGQIDVRNVRILTYPVVSK